MEQDKPSVIPIRSIDELPIAVKAAGVRATQRVDTDIPIPPQLIVQC